jgi:sporulation related protein
MAGSMIEINPGDKLWRLLGLGNHLPAIKKRAKALFDTRIVKFARTAIAASEPRGVRFLFLGLIALLIGCLITGLAGIRYQEPSSQISEGPTLSLQAERDGADLRVSWDRNTAAIVHAQAGVLRIQDGDSRQQDVQLNAVQLRTGSVLYTPVTNNVQMLLEVSGANRQSASEWILVLAAPRGLAPGAMAAKRTALRQPHTVALSATPRFYAVQVGSFRYRANAERLCAEMEARYGPSRLVLQKGDPPLWRVLVGNEATIESADVLGERIRAERSTRQTEPLRSAHPPELLLSNR